MAGLRVAVAGAGLGGLCLAQGLLRTGADGTVYERDAALLCRMLAATATAAAADGSDLVAAVGEYEKQMRAYGYAEVAASNRAEAETGTRRHTLIFGLHRRLVRTPPERG